MLRLRGVCASRSWGFIASCPPPLATEEFLQDWRVFSIAILELPAHSQPIFALEQQKRATGSARELSSSPCVRGPLPLQRGDPTDTHAKGPGSRLDVSDEDSLRRV